MRGRESAAIAPRPPPLLPAPPDKSPRFASLEPRWAALRAVAAGCGQGGGSRVKLRSERRYGCRPGRLPEHFGMYRELSGRVGRRHWKEGNLD